MSGWFKSVWISLNMIVFAVGGQETWNSSIVNKSLSSETKILNDLLRTYERLPPDPGPTTVELGIYINSIDSISEQNMEYTMNIYLRQQWVDPRLAFKPVDNRTLVIKLPDGMWNHIWVPDVFFRNEKKASFHEITVPNRLLRLYPDGRVWYAAKLTVTFSCMMDLKKYPLDTQKCPILFESFGYTTETLKFSWLKATKPVELESNLILPQFIWQNYTQENCSKTYATGNYPCLKLNLHLKRNVGFYFIQLYVPSGLVMVLSWVSFWISIDAVPARITIGLLTVLTMTTQSTFSTSQLPRVSYIKAIDVWMSACLVFVFASLIEYAFVNVFSRREDKEINEILQFRAAMCKGLGDPLLKKNGRENSENGNLPWSEDPERNGKKKRFSAMGIDKMARILFPVAFLIFNFIYWTVYLLIFDD